MAYITKLIDAPPLTNKLAAVFKLGRRKFEQRKTRFKRRHVCACVAKMQYCFISSIANDTEKQAYEKNDYPIYFISGIVLIARIEETVFPL